ncbi:MAG TPA: CDP-alcohol phosphatidyltransferase family protein [Leucothrix sp.]|nr:CDP-alcohol phosphatidyltransferase family protein [Leucothrix sp.]
MVESEGRRPLKVRDTNFAVGIAKWLSQRNITPNQISIASVFFALLAALSFLTIPNSTGAWFSALLAGLFIQMRLLCNLFDGMVAIEGGKSTPAGELFNDIPDRIADPLILVSAGYAISVIPWGDALGWCAGLLAVLTAYIRTLGVSMGAPVSFEGPMAKQHRMAVMTGASALTVVESFFSGNGSVMGYVLLIALIAIIMGSILTAINRTKAIYYYLENSH